MSSFQDLEGFVHNNPEVDAQRSYAHSYSLSCNSTRRSLCVIMFCAKDENLFLQSCHHYYKIVISIWWLVLVGA